MKAIELEGDKAQSLQRRALLKGGLAAALLPLLPGLPARAAVQTPMPRPATAAPGARFAALLYDESHARARAYGRALRNRADITRAISGDPTSAWTELLDPLWRRGPALVAGMTGARALFCIEQLAHCHGMRMLERGVPTGDEALVAWVIGPARQMEG